MKKLILSALLLIISTSSYSQYTLLKSFCNSCNPNPLGVGPTGPLFYDGTFLYGLTSNKNLIGDGNLYKIMPDGSNYSTVFDFPNRSYPIGSLISDGTFLYGMTSGTTINNQVTPATIFKIKPDGTSYTLLFSFSGSNPRENPSGSLIYDGNFLYGITRGGNGNNIDGDGTIFKIQTNGTGYTNIFAFSRNTTGAFPTGSLFFDGTFLYGMTSQGGPSDLGTIFKIGIDGSNYLKLMDFTGTSNGGMPYGSFISDGTFLYGMTSQGGNNNLGTIFKIKTNGTDYTKLMDFAGDINGRTPTGSLLSDGTFLYGMTSSGGNGPNGYGTIFKIKPDGTNYVNLKNFATASQGYDGRMPNGSLISDGTFLYGVTSVGGMLDQGALFKYCKIPITVSAASSSPTLCLNSALTNITHTTTGVLGIGTPIGLPSGITASFANNTVTISGTPTVSGIFNYSIPLTGGCQSLNAIGTINVNPNTVSVASSSPTLCINNQLTNIIHTTTGATGIGTPTGLPTGVIASFANNTITISGTATISGAFNYNVPLTGGCGSINAIGTIIVTPTNTVTVASSNPTLCINTPLTNISHATTGATGIGTPTGLPTGITASFANNTITINGTPTVSGTFNYSIPLTGGCGSINAIGTITILINTVSAETSSPTLCINTILTNIVRTTTGATGIGTPTGLPSGITASFANNTITITGTPTVSGTFNYSIPLTGGCGSINATGNIIVNPVNTVNVTTNPTLCINTQLTNIVRTTTGATGIGTPTGLPTGITASFTNSTITISGTPSVSGTFNYSIPLTGGCGNVNATGTITVTPTNTISAVTSSPTLCINTILTNIVRTTTGATGIGTPTGLPSGITASFANNTITITGTPTVSGTFNYSIPLTGGCGSINATGTIIVNPVNTVNVTTNPTLCINTQLTNIVRTTTGATGIGTPTGLPTGITALFANNTITISGTPSVSGTFNYSIPLTGGCGNVNATGTITVKANNTVTLASSTPTLCINTPLTNIIHTTTGATGIGVSIGLPSGITASFANNTITISGTPTTQAGTYNYSIPLLGCGGVNATGTITVTPANTVSAQSSTQTLCANISNNITHTTTGATGIGTPTGLPSGMAASFINNTITISGTPTVSGTFNYSIPLTGGCGNVNATGTINVYPILASSISADGTIASSININNGSSVQLQLNGSLNAVPNIQWTPATAISSTSASNPIVYPSTSTTYTANFINTNGCLQSTSFVVNVNSQPNIGNLSLTSTTNTTVGLFDTITVNVQLTGATNLYSLFMKVKGNAAVNQYLDYLGYTAGTLLGSGSNVISTPPTVTNGVVDFGITKVGPSSGYSGSGLYYTLTFVTKNISIPDGTVFCFYIDDVSAYNSSGTPCGLNNQGQYCYTFTNQVNVWPGDLNNTKTVTTADILPIGYFYNSTGPARPSATIQWTAQPITLWGYNHNTQNGDAYKVFADSNGDGIINNADQAAIGFNMGQVHARHSNTKPFSIAPKTQLNTLTVGELIVTPNNTIINAANLPQTVTFTVNLNNTGGLNALYGISVNLIFDDTVFDLSTASIDYTGSIFGTAGSDCLVMNYSSTTGVSVGMTRYANAAINGQGLLFKVTLQTKSTLPLITQTQVSAYVDAANNQTGDNLSIQDATISSFTIINNLSINEIKENNFLLYPNPTNDILYLSIGENIGQNINLKLIVINTLGQIVTELPVRTSNMQISTKNWGASGVYFVKIVDNYNYVMSVRKIILK